MGQGRIARAVQNSKKTAKAGKHKSWDRRKRRGEGQENRKTDRTEKKTNRASEKVKQQWHASRKTDETGEHGELKGRRTKILRGQKNSKAIRSR